MKKEASTLVALAAIGLSLAGCGSSAPTVQPKPTGSLTSAIGGLVGGPTPSAAIKDRPMFGGDKYEYSVSGNWTAEHGVRELTGASLVQTCSWQELDGEQLVLRNDQHLEGSDVLTNKDTYYHPNTDRIQIAFEDHGAGTALVHLDAHPTISGQAPGPAISPNSHFQWSLTYKGGATQTYTDDFGVVEDVDTPAGHFQCLHRREVYRASDMTVTQEGDYSPAIGNWVRSTVEQENHGVDATQKRQYELTSTNVDPKAVWPSVPPPGSAVPTASPEAGGGKAGP